MSPRRIATILALAVTGALAGGAAPAAAAEPHDTVEKVICYVKTGELYYCFRFIPRAQTRTAQEDVCVTYDFAGSEFCVLAETSKAAATARELLRENDRCVTYDFAGSEFCVVRDTIG